MFTGTKYKNNVNDIVGGERKMVRFLWMRDYISNGSRCMRLYDDDQRQDEESETIRVFQLLEAMGSTFFSLSL